MIYIFSSRRRTKLRSHDIDIDTDYDTDRYEKILLLTGTKLLGPNKGLKRAGFLYMFASSVILKLRNTDLGAKPLPGTQIRSRKYMLPKRLRTGT